MHTPKSKSISSQGLTSPKSTKSSVQQTSFKNIGLETMLKELLELKLNKQKELEFRKKQEKELFEAFIASIQTSSSSKFADTRLKYKEKKQGILKLASEQAQVMNEKLRVRQLENSQLKFRLKVLEINKLLKEVADSGSEHEISKEISQEISRIQINFSKLNKLNQEISDVLSVEELAPFYKNIIVSLCKEITKINANQKSYRVIKNP